MDFLGFLYVLPPGPPPRATWRPIHWQSLLNTLAIEVDTTSDTV